jgi:hypothetical protein
MTRSAILLLAALAVLPGCDGPKEKLGQEQDGNAAAASGQTLTGGGPNERLGEAQDRADKAAAKARDAAADTLERQGDQLRANADLAADRLDEKAKLVREGKAH